MKISIKLILACILASFSLIAQADFLDEVEHGYADSDGVKIHYATMG